MGQAIFEVLEEKQDKPFLFIASNNGFLIKQILEEYSSNLKIILFSKKPTTTYKTRIYHVTPDLIDSLLSVREKINYAIYFIEEDKDKKYFQKLYKKFEKSQTKIALIIPVRKVRNYYDFLSNFTKNQNISILLLGDVFGSETYGSSLVSMLIRKALVDKQAELTGDDLLSVFPISENDLTKAISLIIFGRNKKRRVFFLFYSSPQTYISTIHLLKRVEPDLEITYQKKAILNTKNINREPESHVTQQELQNEIKAVLGVETQYIISDEKSFENSTKTLNQGLLQHPKRFKSFFIQSLLSKNLRGSSVKKSVLFLLIILSMLFLVNTLAFIFSYFEIKEGLASLDKSNIKIFFSKTDAARTTLIFTHPLSDIIISSPILKETPLANAYRAATKGLELATLASSTYDTIQNTNKSTKELQESIANLTYIYFELSKTDDRKTKLRDINKQLLKLKVDKMLSVSQFAPDLLGFNNKKKYLLLFQNNAELRPTGGFIGSVGELVISKGNIENFQIRDVYELDGQLKAHVEPHYIIRRYLQPHLYLRDSNFNVDFEKSASTSALLYSLETNSKVDGIIALDFEVIKQIIKIIGSIKLFDYDKTLDENSILDFLQTSIESNFFPGSSKKKDLLNALYTQIKLSLADHPTRMISIGKLLPDLIEEKHILLYSTNTLLQGIFSANNYSGSYRDFREENKSTVNDFIAINEANISVNKVNTFIDRKIHYDAEIIDASISSKLIINFSNKHPKNDYRTYLRLLLPLDSMLTGIFIDGKEQKLTAAVTDFRVYEKKGFKEPTGLEINEEKEINKKVYGFITTVGKNSEQEIIVRYKNGVRIPDYSVFSYNLIVAKQPGINMYPFTANIAFPKNISIQNAKYGTANGGILNFKDIIKSQTEFQADLLKK